MWLCFYTIDRFTVSVYFVNVITWNVARDKLSKFSYEKVDQICVNPSESNMKFRTFHMQRWPASYK